MSKKLEPKPKLTSPSVIKGLLEGRGIRLKKGLGQHFLCDENILEKILAAAELEGDELVIEPGAGLGTLTVALAARAREVIAIELDGRLIPLLQANLRRWGRANVEILHRDFLKLGLEELVQTKGFAKDEAKVVGNLPYGITAPILERLTSAWRALKLAVVTIQREVAEKLLAPPGPEASALGVRVRAFAEVELVAQVPRTVFFPPPEVDSAIVRLRFLERPRFTADEELFFKVVRGAFNLRRKTLLQALSRSPVLGLSTKLARNALELAGIEPTRRGETLTLEEFDRLARALARLLRAQ